jgi:hypothetical protein
VHVTLRGAPRDLPFHLDPPTVLSDLNFTLDTDLGAIDILGEMAPFGLYAEVAKQSEAIELFGRPVDVICLEALIQGKRAAGRTKDRLIVPELETLLELRRQP